MFELITNPPTRFFLSAIFLFGICITALLTPLAIHLARKFGAVDADSSRDEIERRDIAACLAGIFQIAGVNLPLKKAVSLQSEIADREILERIEKKLSGQL